MAAAIGTEYWISCKRCLQRCTDQWIRVSFLVLVMIVLGIVYIHVFNPLQQYRAITFGSVKPESIIARTPSQKPLILTTLFTSWLTTKDKLVVHNNTLHLWNAWLPDIQPVLFTNDSDLSKKAINLGWKVLPVLHVTCGKVPVLKSMFLQVKKHFPSQLYGFANSDILFDHRLKNNLAELIYHKHLMKSKGYLITGRRTNVDFRNNINVKSPQNLSTIAKKGSLAGPWGEDYFFTDDHFPWEKFPNLVIGRPAYDNYVVMVGRSNKLHVVDVTHTLLAVHQTTSDGNTAGFKRPNSKCNIQLIQKIKGDQRFRRGCVDCIDLETRFDYRNNITIIKRGKPSICG